MVKCIKIHGTIDGISKHIINDNKIYLNEKD